MFLDPSQDYQAIKRIAEGSSTGASSSASGMVLPPTTQRSFVDLMAITQNSLEKALKEEDEVYERFGV